MKTRLKILFITHYTALYGANRSLLALVESLPKSRYELLVLVPATGPVTKILSQIKVPFLTTTFYDEYYYNNLGSRVLGMKRHLLNRFYYHGIQKEISKFGPDIIHSNSASLHVGAKLAQQLQKPHVWHIREYGFADYHAFHNLGEQNHLKWLNRAAHIIAISETLRQAVLQQVQVPVSIVYNGVMPKMQMDFFSIKQGQEKLVFTLAGAFRKEKGQAMAIKAFSQIASKIPQAILHLPGDASNTYGNYTKELSNRLGLDERVLFSGFVDRADDVYKETDVLLMCSENEAMGRVTAEAFARYIPVIAYKGGANPELVTHEKDGFLYETIEELEAAMLTLAQDVGLRQKMGEAGHRKALQLFTEEDYAAAVEAIYRQVLQAQ